MTVIHTTTTTSAMRASERPNAACVAGERE
jgi:hypothetical protein